MNQTHHNLNWNGKQKPQRSKDFGVKRKRNPIGLGGNGLAVVGSMGERERYSKSSLSFKNATSVDLAWNSTSEVELDSLNFKKFNFFIWVWKLKLFYLAK